MCLVWQKRSTKILTNVQKNWSLYNVHPDMPPLDEIQPVFTGTATNIETGLKFTATYHSATLLHRLAYEGSVATLLDHHQIRELDIVNNSKCWFETEDGDKFTEYEDGRKLTRTEVSLKQLANHSLSLSRCPRSTLHVSGVRLSLLSVCCEPELLQIHRQGAAMADSSPHSTTLLFTQTTVMGISHILSSMPVRQLDWGGALLRWETRWNRRFWRWSQVPAIILISGTFIIYRDDNCF